MIPKKKSFPKEDYTQSSDKDESLQKHRINCNLQAYGEMKRQERRIQPGTEFT